ncbi:MAG: alpha/beta hydrolase [Leptolyngbyaceae cyanobacterium MO_188.B28]|nr:alpha/beta hydrolase [Leptolyngbyaceae cyanobacterium MO_188.B28]
MVFLHGWGGSARYWKGTAEALCHRFDCLLYDLRGFGRSRLPQDTNPATAPGSYTLESYADDLAELLDTLNLNRVYLNAHSMGASIGVIFLNQYTDRVIQAILTCHGLLEYDAKAFDAFHRFSRYVVAFRPGWLKQIPLAPRMFMARFLHRSIPNAERRAFLEDFLMADYEAALGTIYTSVSKEATEEMPEAYRRVPLPTLLISGQYDQIIEAEMGRQAATLNDKVEYVVIPNTSHFPMLEDPDAYLQHINAFLVD